MNIVRINEEIFKAMNTANSCSNCWSYTYGRKHDTNLVVKEKCCVHAYLEEWTEDNSYVDTQLDRTTHNFTLKLLLDSLIDIQIFNELEPTDAKSKFAQYVEPILDCFKIAYRNEVCALGFEITRLRIKAEYNKKDQNKDGISCQVTIIEQL